MEKQEQVVEKALEEIRMYGGVSFDQYMFLQKYLSWVYSIGFTHGRRSASSTNKKPIAQVNPRTGRIIQEFESASDAARVFKVAKQSILTAVNDKTKACKGMYFKRL
jgi:hypothetical protein